MSNGVRIFGSAASAAANLLLFVSIAAGWPRLQLCDLWLCGEAQGPPPLVVTLQPWSPFVDNPGVISAGWDIDPSCPAPAAAGDAVILERAPLPAAFDPHAYPGGRLYACVKADAAGRVLAARLVAPTGRAPLDRALVAAIRSQWRFSARLSDETEPLWHRVRLDSGPVEGSVHRPMLIL